MKPLHAALIAVAVAATTLGSGLAGTQLSSAWSPDSHSAEQTSVNRQQSSGSLVRFINQSGKTVYLAEPDSSHKGSWLPVATVAPGGQRTMWGNSLEGGVVDVLFRVYPTYEGAAKAATQSDAQPAWGYERVKVANPWCICPWISLDGDDAKGGTGGQQQHGFWVNEQYVFDHQSALHRWWWADRKPDDTNFKRFDLNYGSTR